MNFLSHLYLSGNSEGIIIGNYIADSVKGSAYTNYSQEIKNGILLHRKIDTFTDTHPIVEQSKQRLRANYRKYAGVIIDIYYDHYLAVNWQLYSDVSLKAFADNIYAIVLKYHDVLPEKSVLFTKYMIRHDILVAYSTLQGIERVLNGMASRTQFESNMEHAINDLKEHYQLFENEFKLFFPQLRQYVEEEMSKLEK